MPPDHPEYLDRYRILDILGRGSMGDVYLAVDPKFDRKIALKVMSAHRLGLQDELQDLRRRFVHEALAAGRLNHPDIVTIHDADTDKATGWPFIAMEWVEGESLRVRLRRDGPLDVQEALAMTSKVARALDYAHRQGVVHRDIKPANLLLRADDDRPKIADFGVAKLVSSSLTLTGQVLGSPNYMSPEQVKAEAIDGRTDLFALGVVLYESLAGRPAFAADSLASITFKIVNVDPRPVGMYNSLAPEAVQRLLDRALAKNPADRFSSGAEMAAAADEVATELSSHPHRKRQTTKELTLPAGVPEAPAAQPAEAHGQTVDARKGADPSTSGRPARRSILPMAAVALVAVVLGFFAAKLWLEAPTKPDLGTLTRNLGIFERLTPDDGPEEPQDAAADETAGRALLAEAEDVDAPGSSTHAETGEAGDIQPSSMAKDPSALENGPTAESEEPASPGETDLGFEGLPRVVDPETPPLTLDLEPPPQTADAAPPAAAETEPTEPQPPPPAVELPKKPEPKPARMTVALEKRFKLAYISIWVDGKKVRTRRMEGGNWVRRLAGQSYEFEVPVPAGEHKIQAHISGLSTRLEAQGKIIGDFEPGRSKTLWIEVRRHPDKLQLTWKDR